MSPTSLCVTNMYPILGLTLFQWYQKSMAQYDSLKTLSLGVFKTVSHTITYADHTFVGGYQFPELPIPEELEVKDVLGEGGMGVVYRGIQSHPEREVAIKRLKQQSPYMRLALYREAMITGALSHPTIIPIHTVNLRGPQAPEVVMKRIEGDTILDLISTMNLNGSADAQIPLRKLLNVLRQVCNGLEYAHSKGVFHRDIKPENIMVGSFGEVYILDWGIAVSDFDLPKFPDALVGTPSYIAPEMISGSSIDVDARTDVYLLGATLHHVLTGTPRHRGGSIQEVLESARASKSHEYDHSVPKLLADLVNQACHPDPDQRIQSPADFRHRIGQFLEYQQAYGISRAAEKDLSTLQRLVELDDPTKSQRYAIQRHYNRCRFGFEQALEIWPNFEVVQYNLNQAKIAMIEHYLARKKLDAVLPLLDEVEQVPRHLSQEVTDLLTEQSSIQYELEQYREDQNRKQSSTLFRSSMLVGMLGSLVVMLYYLFQIEEVDPNTLSAELLFFHSLVLTIPIAPVVFFGRNRLFVSSNARRALIAIAGIMLALILHRWIAMEYQELPSSIIVTDFFIAGLGFANTAPSIRYGRLLGIMCFAIGIINHLFPITFWFGTLLMVVVLGLCIYGDWRRNWNEPVRKTYLD